MHQNSEENIQVVILDLILGFELAVMSMLNCLLSPYIIGRTSVISHVNIVDRTIGLYSCTLF